MDGEAATMARAAPPGFDPALDRFLLQRVALRPPGYAFAPRLYHVTLRGQAAFSERGLWLAPDSAVGFNTYANSFYAAYWARATDLSEIEICGLIRGRGFLRAFRASSPHGLQDLGSFVIGSRDGAAAVPFRVPVPLRSIPNPARTEGRIFFDIASETECEVSDLAFATARPPVRPVLLSIGICTFRKEEHMLPNLENLERFLGAGGDAWVDRAFVVNNANAPIESPLIRAIAARCPCIELVDQPNLGGAGGFTRSLAESLARSPATHHVMIDDDVFIDPHVIEKTALFLAHARGDLAVGGQMMNMRAPQVLYEGGAKLGRNGLLERVGVNIDCAKPDTIGFFDIFREVDYNAWWFCAFPKSAVAAVGLPLNVFIRGDDFEYGTRLKEAGVPTVSLPGIYVWHEPFEQKTAAWLEYYNMRNRLIFCATHAEKGGFEQLPRTFYQDFCDGALAEGDLEKLAATLLGIGDFLAGPARHFGQDAEARHGALRALLARVRAEHGLMAAGPGHAALVAALLDRLPGLDAFLADALATAGEADPLAESGFGSARAAWIALIDGVLSAFEHGVADVSRTWAQEAGRYVSDGYWQDVFARRLAAA